MVIISPLSLLMLSSLSFGAVLIRAPWGENLVLKAGQTVPVEFETSSLATLQLLQVYSPLRQDPFNGALAIEVTTSGTISYAIPNELPEGPQLYAFKLNSKAAPMQDYTYSVSFKIDPIKSEPTSPAVDTNSESKEETNGSSQSALTAGAIALVASIILFMN